MRKVEEERATGNTVKNELRTVRALLEREVGEGVDTKEVSCLSCINEVEVN